MLHDQHFTTASVPSCSMRATEPLNSAHQSSWSQPLLSAQQAILFVTALDAPREEVLRALATTLQRLQVHAEQRRIVALEDEPELGRQYRVRVVPCLVLDTGARQIRLSGDPARLDPVLVEDALTRQ